MITNFVLLPIRLPKRQEPQKKNQNFHHSWYYNLMFGRSFKKTDIPYTSSRTTQSRKWVIKIILKKWNLDI